MFSLKDSKLESDAEKITYTDTLYTIPDLLSKSELDQLKFVCSDIIPFGNLEKMDGADLLQTLLERRKITEQDVDFLIECLILIGRKDIASMLDCQQEIIDDISHDQEKFNSSVLNRFRILLYYFADNITKSEVKKLILYLNGGKVAFPKAKISQFVSGFDLINHLIKATFVHKDKLNNLVEIAKRLDRWDLIEKLEIYSGGSTSRKNPNNIQLESSCRRTAEIRGEITGGKSMPSDWRQLLDAIPTDQRFRFCEDLSIPMKQMKHCSGQLDEVLSQNFQQNGFEVKDLEKALKNLSLDEPLSLEQFQPISGHTLEKYTMTAKPRGICLIINNKVFESHESRQGSDLDMDALRGLFKSFHFQVIVAENLKGQQMKDKFTEVARMDHSKYNCFVCCILSHGMEGKIFGVDGDMLLYKELRTPFKPIHCKGLTGKPKLFFIQACQGNVNLPGTKEEPEEMEMDGPSNGPSLVPHEADFLMAYSTVPGYTSFRSKSKGSWFIRNLTDVFSKNAKKHDVTDMLLMVNNSVSKEVGRLNENEVTQIPAPLNMLRKKVFFLNDD